MSSAEAKKRLAIGRIGVSKRAPYLTAAVVSLVPYEIPPGVLPPYAAGIGVSDKGILYYEAEKIAKWSKDEMVGSLIHEVLHLLREHGKRRGKRDPMMWNFAGDAEINDDIEQMGIKLPGAVMPAMFQRPNGLTAEEYYSSVTSKAQASQGGSGVGRGQCGGCAGNGQSIEEHLPDDIKAAGRSAGEIKAIQKQTAAAIKAHEEKQRGSVPSDLLRWAEAALGPSVIPWEEKLAAVAMNAVTDFVAGEADFAFDRISRRQGGSGYGAGKPIFPALVDPIIHVWVPFDTSGSMSETELSIGLREVKAILEQTSAKVTFLACDAALHSMAPIETIEDCAQHLRGGGGTDFHPVFEAADRETAERPCLIVYVTDGCGPAPAHPPDGIGVIWLLVGHYKQMPYTAGGEAVTYGEVVEIDDDPAKRRL